MLDHTDPGPVDDPETFFPAVPFAQMEFLSKDKCELAC